MTSMSNIIAAGVAMLVVTIALVLVLTKVILNPATIDLIYLLLFLSISGGASVGLGFLAARCRLPWWVKSLRSRMIAMSATTALLVLFNVVATAVFLMFLNKQDLLLIAGLLSFSVGVSIFVGFMLSGPTARSVKAIAGAAERMSDGDLDARAQIESLDEIGDLASAFNAMAGKLQASIDHERDLEEARRELISAVSHDLRTPLSSIRVMIESMYDGVVSDPETVRRYLATTLSETERLSRLVDNLFELSQIASGTLELHLETALMQDLISDMLESMSAQAVNRRLRLQGAVDDELSPVTMDTQRVQRVLYNLVQNAIRHTPPDGSIHIRARDIGAEVQVQVADTGEGIPNQALEKVFERSYRVDPSRSRESGGAGLGLSIAKGIVEAHGGRIWVESIPNRGSTFSFTLPKAPRGVSAFLPA